MAKLSAGILPYRWREGVLQVLLVHPGGPFWKNKDAGVWSIAKGEYAAGENPLAAARREFEEETGFSVDQDEVVSLGSLRQAGGKQVEAWAVEAAFMAEQARSNQFEMEWPPKSGRMQSFPEVDRAEWFEIESAHEKMLPSQHPFLDRLIELAKKS